MGFTLTRYVALSVVAASAVLYHAFATRQYFYRSTIYLSSSKIAVAAMGNLAFALALVTHQLVIKMFLGSLRDIEQEMIRERLSSAVMESLLALTIFREEFSTFFVAMFASLVFVKVMHWLVQDRVDYVEVTPTISFFGHARIVSFMALLLAIDVAFLQYTISQTIQTSGQSVMLLFAFEYVILASTIVRYALKYAMSMVDLAMDGNWTGKGTAVFYLELIADLLHLFVYGTFFAIVFMNYGLPLHLVRELYSTFRNFRTRMHDFMRFRQVTARLDRFPDATAEDLRRCDGVCIICREEMADAGANKRLYCGHVFHLHCLRSWLERQQNCPTCRASVFRRPGQPHAHGQNQQQQPPAAAAAAPPVAGAAPADAAAAQEGRHDHTGRAAAPGSEPAAPAPSAAAPATAVPGQQQQQAGDHAAGAGTHDAEPRNPAAMGETSLRHRRTAAAGAAAVPSQPSSSAPTAGAGASSSAAAASAETSGVSGAAAAAAPREASTGDAGGSSPVASMLQGTLQVLRAEERRLMQRLSATRQQLASASLQQRGGATGGSGSAADRANLLLELQIAALLQELAMVRNRIAQVLQMSSMMSMTDRRAADAPPAAPLGGLPHFPYFMGPVPAAAGGDATAASGGAAYPFTPFMPPSAPGAASTSSAVPQPTVWPSMMAPGVNALSPFGMPVWPAMVPFPLAAPMPVVTMAMPTVSADGNGSAANAAFVAGPATMAGVQVPLYQHQLAATAAASAAAAAVASMFGGGILPNGGGMFFMPQPLQPEQQAAGAASSGPAPGSVPDGNKSATAAPAAAPLARAVESGAAKGDDGAAAAAAPSVSAAAQPTESAVVAEPSSSAPASSPEQAAGVAESTVPPAAAASADGAEEASKQAADIQANAASTSGTEPQESGTGESAADDPQEEVRRLRLQRFGQQS